MCVGRFNHVTQLVTRTGHVCRLFAYSVGDQLDYPPRHLRMSVEVFFRLPSVTTVTYYFKLGYDVFTPH
jgi:hypothetical protein